MEQKKIPEFASVEYIFGAMFVALGIYIYTGFFFPDEYTLSFGIFPSIILWVIRILFPFIIAGLIVLFIRVRLKKTDHRAVIMFFMAMLFSTIIAYQFADKLYQDWFDRNRNKYHPYLQLVPQEYHLRSDSSSQVIRIFCLGGSTTELADSKGKDWESRVETILKNEYGITNVEVYNLGREWYTTLHTLINYETNLRQHKPSVILIMQSLNDLLHNADFSVFSHDTFREDYGHFYGPVNRIIQHGSLLDKMNSIVAGLWYAYPKEVITTDIFPGIVSYERNLKTIIELAKNDSTKIILMTEPSLFKSVMSTDEISVLGMLKVEAINEHKVWSLQTATNGMQQYNSMMKTIAKNHNLPLIDLDSVVPKSLTYFRDDVHYTDTTFSLIAPFIAHELNRYIGIQKTMKTK
ncbi:MAG TPA: hypothetical protein DCQ28_07440 [Bacteroidetes bacterium]|nr:hypothetical protein [Bacteroidota bacterium]